MQNSSAFQKRLQKIFGTLGIALDFPQRRSLVIIPEPYGIIERVEYCIDNEFHLLVPTAAKAWHTMAKAALEDKVELLCVSGFRSVQRQAELIEMRLAKDESIDDILTHAAPPGYSQHHSGMCIDICSPDCPNVWEKDFSQTTAFAWLKANSEKFGWVNTMTPSNRWGYIYEPWHYYFNPPAELMP